MAINYPSSLDNFTNPAAGSLITNPPHGQQHADANDAIEALQVKLGVAAGTPTATNKLLVSTGTGTSTWSGTVSSATFNNIAVGTSQITGGTLTSPTIAVGSDTSGDMYYRSSGGSLTRLGLGTTGQVITTNGTIPTWGNGAGKILQVVSTTYSTETANSAGTSINTGLLGTITPTLSSSRIMIMFSQGDVSVSSNTVFIGLELARGTTQIFAPVVFSGGLSTGGSGPRYSISSQYVDSPATTSPTVYKTQFRVSAGTGTAYVQRDSSTASMILMEVAA